MDTFRGFCWYLALRYVKWLVVCVLVGWSPLAALGLAVLQSIYYQAGFLTGLEAGRAEERA